MAALSVDTECQFQIANGDAIILELMLNAGVVLSLRVLTHTFDVEYRSEVLLAKSRAEAQLEQLQLLN